MRRSAILALVLAAGSITGCAGGYGYGYAYYAPVPPPPARVEVVGVAPGPGVAPGLVAADALDAPGEQGDRAAGVAAPGVGQPDRDLG